MALDKLDSLNDLDLSSITKDYDLKKLWLNWHICLDPSDQDSLLSSNFELKTKEFDTVSYYQVSIPFLALYELAESYNWLQVLRNPNHKPQDPYELVRFINLLNNRYS